MVPNDVRGRFKCEPLCCRAAALQHSTLIEPYAALRPMAAFRCRKTLAPHTAREVRRFVSSQVFRRCDDTQNVQVLEAMPFTSYTVD